MLRYLVGAVGQPSLRLINEYAIGIDVFRRDPATYSTGEDPIVRVQLGRLRHRLEDYYRTDGSADPVRITLPMGSYTPRIERNAATQALVLRLACHAARGALDGTLEWFVEGLQDELRHRLHQEIGAAFVEPGQTASSRTASHVLECSVRSDGIAVRNSLRLIDTAQGRILWSRQVDHGMDLSIACQEYLATLCCAAVRALACGELATH